MLYDAITIDTSTVERNGLNLGGGLLGQLSQFKTGSVKFVLSEIVFRELKKHLIRECSAAKDTLLKAVRDSAKTAILSDSNLLNIRKASASTLPPDQAAVIRLGDFIKRTGAEIVPANKANWLSLIDSYFSATPPLSKRRGKRKMSFLTPSLCSL